MLKEAVDAIAPGHAAVILNGDVPDGAHRNRELQVCRDRLVAWQELHWYRHNLRCRVRAQALLAAN